MRFPRYSLKTSSKLVIYDACLVFYAFDRKMIVATGVLLLLINNLMMSSQLLKDEVICVVGASSGIGAAIAGELFKHGAKLVIGARRLTKLQEIVQQCQETYPDSVGHILPIECDCTDVKSVQKLVDYTIEQYKCTPTVMVDVAGVMFFTKMANTKLDEWNLTIDTNCKGATNCLGTILPKFLENKKGKVIFITSDAGVRDFQNLAVYCASKRFVETLVEITRRELVGTGVTLHTIQPGDVKGTELIMKNTDQEAAKDLGVEINKPVGEGFSRNQLLDPKDVAEAVVTVLSAPSHVAINSILIEPRDQE